MAVPSVAEHNCNHSIPEHSTAVSFWIQGMD